MWSWNTLSRGTQRPLHVIPFGQELLGFRIMFINVPTTSGMCHLVILRWHPAHLNIDWRAISVLRWHFISMVPWPLRKFGLILAVSWPLTTGCCQWPELLFCSLERRWFSRTWRDSMQRVSPLFSHVSDSQTTIMLETAHEWKTVFNSHSMSPVFLLVFSFTTRFLCCRQWWPRHWLSLSKDSFASVSLRAIHLNSTSSLLSSLLSPPIKPCCHVWPLKVYPRCRTLALPTLKHCSCCIKTPRIAPRWKVCLCCSRLVFYIDRKLSVLFIFVYFMSLMLGDSLHEITLREQDKKQLIWEWIQDEWNVSQQTQSCSVRMFEDLYENKLPKTVFGPHSCVFTEKRVLYCQMWRMNVFHLTSSVHILFFSLFFVFSFSFFHVWRGRRVTCCLLIFHPFASAVIISCVNSLRATFPS